LVAFDDLIIGYGEVAFLALFLLADGSETVAGVELVEGDLLAGFNGVENLNRDRDEGKRYAAFPDAAHGVLLI
jgi:hypothetical protein